MDFIQLSGELNLLHKQICAGLADPKRMVIMYLLNEQPRYVNELVDLMDCPQSTISRHLRVLRERDLITGTRRGTAIQYSITDARIIDAMDLMREVLAAQMEQKAQMSRNLND